MARSSPRPRGNNPAPEDQMALFAPAPSPAAEPLSLQTELRQLMTQITARTRLGYKEVNNRLNRKLGVPTRQGAPSEVIERAIQLARQWLALLDAPKVPPPAPRPPQPLARPRAAQPRRRSAPAALRQPPAPSGPPPTPEQERAIEAKQSGSHLAVQAGAGTGKTTLLTMLARSAPRERGLFLAYNRSVVDDAARKFPSNVRCMTGHGLAMREIGRRYSARLNAPREPSWKVGERIGIHPNMKILLGSRLITHKTISYTVFETVRRFCHSADTEILPKHVPSLRNLPDDHRTELGRLVLPYARRAWADLQNPDRGLVRFEPDHFMKIWALTEPTIHADFLLLDEAQDTNRVLEKVFAAQRGHAQLIMVGDSAQAIYGWRGARDVMTDFDGTQLTLTQSFRFGQALADEANRWLHIVESPLRLKGSPHLNTSVGPVEHPTAVLCRSNSGAIYEVLHLLSENKRVAMAGGSRALEQLALAAGQLKSGRRTSHPELCLFTSWDELHEYANHDPSGGDLLPLVDIVDQYGAEIVLTAVRNLHPEQDAEVVISTAHKAKGREWPTVTIADDFEPKANNRPAPETNDDRSGQPGIDLAEARLAYVAVTRARERLDLGGLSWINDYPSPPTTPAEPPPPPQAASPWDRLGPPPVDSAQ